MLAFRLAQLPSQGRIIFASGLWQRYIGSLAAIAAAPVKEKKFDIQQRYRSSTFSKAKTIGVGAPLSGLPVTLARSSASAVTAAATGNVPKSYTGKFTLERVWALGMVPLFPLAYYMPGPVMDFALAVGVGVHIFWGLEAVMTDYARPYVIGETLRKLAMMAVYVASAAMMASLMIFNYEDVGITKAFKIIWSL